MDYRENILTFKEYRTLRESVGWCNFTVEQSASVLKNSLYTVLALDGEEAAGMGRLIGDGMYYVIVDVVVAPSFQGRGVGSRIMNKLLKYVEEHTPPGRRASIQLISEKGKEPFYEKLGFKRIPHEFCGSGMRLVLRKAGPSS